MQTLVERGCGLDVHQATVVACLLQVGKDGEVSKQMRTFGSTTRELVSLREWLQTEGCTQVAMESTGGYWKPVYAILEGAFQIVVANAQQVKRVPGRKTDVKDAEWIADLLCPGRSLPRQAQQEPPYPQLGSSARTFGLLSGIDTSANRGIARKLIFMAVGKRQPRSPQTRNAPAVKGLSILTV